MQSSATKPIGPTERRKGGVGGKNQVLTAEWEDGIPPALIISFQLKPLPEITEEMDFASCPPAPATSADTRTCAKSKGESTAIRDHQMITTMTLCKKKEKHQHSLWLAVWLACRTRDFWIDSSMNFPNKLSCTIHVLYRNWGVHNHMCSSTGTEVHNPCAPEGGGAPSSTCSREALEKKPQPSLPTFDNPVCDQKTL